MVRGWAAAAATAATSAVMITPIIHVVIDIISDGMYDGLRPPLLFLGTCYGRMDWRMEMKMEEG